MRLLFLFVLTALLGACQSQLSKDGFARIYVDSLSKRFPGTTFTITQDLAIVASDSSSVSYIDNAYDEYKQDPESLTGIITRHINSLATSMGHDWVFDSTQVIPLIKSLDYLNESSTAPSGQKTEFISEQYNDQLVIMYAQDSPTNIIYFPKEDFQKQSKLGIDALRRLAVANLGRILPKIEKNDMGGGVCMVTAGGNYEASILLLPDFWTKQNFPFKGELVIAVPNRDILLVTGSEEKDGLQKLKAMTKKSFDTGSYNISPYIYKWNGRFFEKFDQ